MKARITKYVKQHPEIFNQNDQNIRHAISDSDIPGIEWFYEKNRALVQKGKKYRQAKRWYLSKPIMIPLYTALVLGIFLGTTPTGHAVVNTLYNTVVSWMTGEVRIWHGTTRSLSEEIDLEETVFESAEEVEAAYHIEVVRSNFGTLDEIEVEQSDFQVIVHAKYSVADNCTVSITQVVSDTEAESSYSVNYNEGQVVEEKTSDGIEVIGYVNDGIAYAVAFKDNISLDIYSDNITYSQFVDFLRNLQLG